MNFSEKALSISASPTLAIDAKAKQMREEGLDVIGFGVGEPDFDTPDHIKQAAILAINNGCTKYTPPSGILELKKVICDKLSKDNGLLYQPNQIIVSNGAKHSLMNIFKALLNPMDEVIIPAPYWVSYPEMVKLSDGIPIILKTKAENNFKLTKVDLESSLTEKTKMIIINSPSNPTGQVYTKEELQIVADFAVKNDLYVISDEIYEKLIYGEEDHISIASLGKEIYDRTIVVNGLSKSYAMTGWRIGYTASNEKIAHIMSNIQSHETSNPNSIAQKAAVAAISGPQGCVEEMKVKFNERRQYMIDRLAGIKGMHIIAPQGAFYVFVHLGDFIGKSYQDKVIKDSNTFADILLDAGKVAVVPGNGFGAPEYIRLSYATSIENIKLGMDRIQDFISNVK